MGASGLPHPYGTDSREPSRLSEESQGDVLSTTTTSWPSSGGMRRPGTEEIVPELCRPRPRVPRARREPSPSSPRGQTVGRARRAASTSTTVRAATAVDEAQAVEFSEDDVLDEARWHLFAGGRTAAAAVASTLTLPIVVDRRTIVRSSQPLRRARRTRSTASTRRSQRRSAPGPRGPSSTPISASRLAVPLRRHPGLFEATRIQIAVGILASLQDVSPPVARDRLKEAAHEPG